MADDQSAAWLRIEDVDAMWGRLQRARESRIWFKEDTELLDAISAAQESLRVLTQQIIASESSYVR